MKVVTGGSLLVLHVSSKRISDNFLYLKSIVNRGALLVVGSEMISRDKPLSFRHAQI